MLPLNAEGYTGKMTHKAAFYALTTAGVLPVTLRESDAVRLLQRARAIGEGYVNTASYRVDAYEREIHPNRFLSSYELRLTPR